MADTDAGFVLDGNAAASLLHEVFVFDVTTAQIQCAACGAVELLGALPLYAASMGVVLRCMHCDAILIRAVRTSHGRWLEMTGTRYLRS
jgi:uncharacterized protein DUF6510